MKRMGNIPSGAPPSTKRFDNLNGDLRLTAADMVGAVSIQSNLPINVYMPDGIQLQDIRHCLIHNAGSYQLSILDSAGNSLLPVATLTSALVWAVTAERSPGTWTALNNFQGTSFNSTLLSATTAAGATQNISSVCALDSNRALVFYSNTGSSFKVQLVTISGTTATALGSSVAIGAGIGTSLAAVNFDTDRTAVFWKDNSSAQATLIIITSTNNSLSIANTVTTSAQNGQEYDLLAICRLSSSKLALAGKNTISQYPEVMVATVTSGNASTIGNPAATGTSIVAAETSICKLDTDKFMLFYIRDTSTAPLACAFTCSGTTVNSTGTEIVIGSANSQNPSAAQYDIGRALVAFTNSATSRTNFYGISVSGVTLTAGSVSAHATVNNTNLSAFGYGHVYACTGSSSRSVQKIRLDGTAVTQGTAVTVSLNGNTAHTISMLSRDKFIEFTPQGGTGYPMVTVYATGVLV